MMLGTGLMRGWLAASCQFVQDFDVTVVVNHLRLFSEGTEVRFSVHSDKGSTFTTRARQACLRPLGSTLTKENITGHVCVWRIHRSAASHRATLPPLVGKELAH